MFTMKDPSKRSLLGVRETIGGDFYPWLTYSCLAVPPEPNGFLHIGHSKAIAINFGFAKYHGGECYLRLDDTNPEEEESVYEKSIIDTVRWLGFKPKAVTYSSDHFQRLYNLAEKLIEIEKAYVCYCTSR